MSRIRRITAGIAGVVASIAALVAAAPAAFAVGLYPPDGTATSSSTVTHAGMAGWEIVLIATAAVAIGAVLVTVLRRTRYHSRLGRVAG